MLGMGSQTARNMGSRSPRAGSPMDSILQGRRQRYDDRMRARENTEQRRRWHEEQKARRSRESREDRQHAQDRLVTNRDNRTVIHLLEEIAEGIRSMGKSGLGNLLSEGLLGRVLSRSGLGKNRNGGLIRDARGRWRDPVTGKYAKAPERNRFGRVVDKLRESKVGRSVAGAGETVANSRFGKMFGKVAKPFASGVGKFAAGPGGRLLGGAARVGANVLGKLAVPLAIGMTAYSGVHGMTHADEILGRKTDLKEKAAVGVSEAVNSLLMGLPNWISKHVFGMSFSKLMVDGLDDIGKKVKESVTNAIEGAKNLIGKTVGSIGAYFSDAFEATSKYVKEVQAAGGELIDAVKGLDAMGAAAALGKIGKLLFKGAVAVPVAVAKGVTNATVVGGQAIGRGAAAAGHYVGEKASQAADTVKGWLGLGSTSAKYESGSRGTAAISSGKGDPGGASYGKYQLASKTGTLQAYLRQSGYGAQFAGLQPGSKEFNAKWKELAKSDPKFGESQHEFIKRTHFDPAAAHAAKLGFNMQNKGVQDAVWSASVQHGGVKKLLTEASRTQGWEQMTDEQKLQRLYQVRTDYATRNMARNGASRDQIASVQKRYGKEVNDVVMLSKQGNVPAANGMQVQATMADAKAAVAKAPAGSKAAAATSVATNASATASAPATVPARNPVDGLRSLLAQAEAAEAADAKVVRQGSNPLKIKTSATSSVPDHAPLIEEMPKLVDKPLPVSKQPEQKPPSQTSQGGSQQARGGAGASSGRGGLPSVNDVADRPRIDLQPIATTLHAR